MSIHALAPSILTLHPGTVAGHGRSTCSSWPFPVWAKRSLPPRSAATALQQPQRQQQVGPRQPECVQSLHVERVLRLRSCLRLQTCTARTAERPSAAACLRGRGEHGNGLIRTAWKDTLPSTTTILQSASPALPVLHADCLSHIRCPFKKTLSQVQTSLF